MELWSGVEAELLIGAVIKLLLQGGVDEEDIRTSGEQSNKSGEPADRLVEDLISALFTVCFLLLGGAGNEGLFTTGVEDKGFTDEALELSR